MSDEEYLRVFGKNREQMLKETREELRSAMKNKDKTLAKELFEKLKKAYIGDDIFWANEVGTNIFVATVMGIIGAILLITVVLSLAGVYSFDNNQLIPNMAIVGVLLLVGIVLCIAFRGEKHWVKYVLMLLMCNAIFTIFTFLGYRAVISLTIPVIISTKYLSENFTRVVSCISGIFMLLATVFFAIYGVSVDQNFVVMGSDSAVVTNEYIHNLLLRSFLPNILQFLLIAYICCVLAKWGHKALIDQAESAKKFARVDTELGIAKEIQTTILPCIFPPFPDRSEFDIYATMDAAKEVGGDFYDFFLVDDDHLAIVVADVSDKGIPAALFMMIGKTLIKSQTMLKKGPGEVLEIVNNQLCENNEVGLFISAWLGILDIKTGKIVAANAGHEYPAVKTGNEYKFIKHKPGFVLAGVEGTKYEEYEIQLNPGDGIFLYTDGVTEATNEDKNMFGKDALLASLNGKVTESQSALLQDVRKDIDTFVGKASQHDDITMVGLNYIGIK